MKVLHFINENTLSWANPFLQLLQYLNHNGVRNVLLCPPGGTLTQKALDYEIDFLHYEPRFSFLPYLCRDFKRIAGSWNPDLIHTRLSCAASIASEWKERIGCPVLATVDKYAKLKYYRKADHLVAVSGGVKNWFIKMGYPPEKISVIGNPLNLKFYERAPDLKPSIRFDEDLSEDTKIVIGAGRFVEWKGFDILLKAVEKALEKRDFILWLVGDGPEKYKLETYVASSRTLSGKVRFWGFKNDIRPFLWGADLFVLPSSNPEPFGLVLLEAMACGLPVIATSAGGPLDIISDDMGWLVPPRDIDSLCSSILNALDNVSLRSIGELALTRASLFDVNKIGNQYLNKYRSLVR